MLPFSSMTTAKMPSSRRHRSRELLLEIIRREGGITRAELCRKTGLSRSAVADSVQDLLTERLVIEDVLEPGGKGAGRGRPSALLVVAPPRGVVLGIDFGHTHVSVAVATTEGRVLADQQSDVNVDAQSSAALDVAAGAAHRLLSQLGLSISDVRAITAGIPAPLDLRTKRIKSSSIMTSWAHLEPERELGGRLGSQVCVVNDADLGAGAEVRFGAAKGCRDVVYVKTGEGIGASLILNGSPYQGSQGIAGEIGHTNVTSQEGWCRCGNRGCLETVVSSSLVEERLRAVGLADVPDPDFPLARSSEDPAVSRFVMATGRILGRVLADICNCLNPAMIVLGGVLGTAGQPLVDGVRESINLYAQPANAAVVDVRTAQLGLRAELMGAVAHACQRAIYLA